MDNQNPLPPPASSSPTTPPTVPTPTSTQISSSPTMSSMQSPPPPSFLQRKKIWVIGGIVLVLLIVGMSSFFLPAKNTTDTAQTIITPSPTQLHPSLQPTAVPSPTDLPTTTSLPADWIIQNSSVCHMGIPIPPKKEPYYIPENPNTPPSVNDEGGFWQFQEREVTSENDKFFTHEALAIFQNPDALGNDYVAGMVQVICGPNTKSYSTQSFVDAYAIQYTDGTFAGLDFKQIGKKTVWGKEVIEATITGGMYSEDDREYYVATPQAIYRIRTISLSANAFIKETTEKILQNLQFSK